MFITCVLCQCLTVSWTHLQRHWLLLNLLATHDRSCRFQDLITVFLMIQIFWDVIQCMRYPITKFLEGHGQWWYINSVKDSVYVPPLPMSLQELRDRITHALQTITADMLHRVWDEFDYRVDVCRVTRGAHSEGLWLTHEKLGQLPLLTVYVVPV
jgi:hypothetical protein